MVAAEEAEVALAVAVEMGGLPPVQHPLAAVEHAGPVSGLQQGVVDLVVHDHLGGVGHADLFVEELLGVVLAALHLLLEELDVEGESEAVVGLHPDQLAVGMGHQLAGSAPPAGCPSGCNCHRKLTENPRPSL